MKNLVLTLKAALVLSFLLPSAACDTSDMENEVPRIPTRIDVSTDANSIPVGKQLKFNAIAYDQHGQPIENLWIDWGSTSEGIASVNTVGMVSALSSGETTITASSKAVSGSALVTITAVDPQASRVAKIVINDSEEITIGIGKSKKLEGQVLDQYDVPLSGLEVGWNSSDVAVVEVDNEGLLTGKSAGTAIVEMSVGKYRTSTSVTVSGMASIPTSIDIYPLASRQARGETIAFTARVLDQYGQEMEDVDVEWLNNNSCAVSLNEAGYVTAVSAGEAEVVAKIGNISSKGYVTVLSSSVLIPPSIDGLWTICSPSLEGNLQLTKEAGTDELSGIITTSDGLTRRATGSYAGNVVSLRWESIDNGILKINFIRGAKHTDQYLLEGMLIEGNEASNIRISRTLN